MEKLKQASHRNNNRYCKQQPFSFEAFHNVTPSLFVGKFS
jgi:hypothetical protein